MITSFCDRCGLPIHGREEDRKDSLDVTGYILKLMPLPDIEQYDLNTIDGRRKAQEVINKAGKSVEQNEICLTCKKIIDIILRSRKKDISELTKEINKLYGL